jgi:catechol 2,3-dioxygenase-like lactoylglutathione lyase family enzyme
MTSRVNHVSVSAPDLQRSVDFYVELLGAEPIQEPNVGIPVRWLALGDTQLHLFNRDVPAPEAHHLGIAVDALEPVYRVAERLGAFDDGTFGHRLIALPDGVFQLYVRDPAGNLVELNAPAEDDLPEDIAAHVVRLVDLYEHTDAQRTGRLFVG